MQAEILSAKPDSRIRILGVNKVGEEAANDVIVQGRTLPWLQDVDSIAWGGWAVTWRDVVVLDEQNRRVAVFSLTQNSLSLPSNYAALVELLRSFAKE